MNTELIIRAWKDPEFRASLSSEERSALPECPAGPAFTELNESELEETVGGGVLQVAFDVSECICSNFTVTRWTTTRTVLDRGNLLTQNPLAF